MSSKKQQREKVSHNLIPLNKDLDKIYNKIAHTKGFYDLSNILKFNVLYYVIFGTRSYGKTFQVLLKILYEYLKYGYQGASFKRFSEDFKGKFSSDLMNKLVQNDKYGNIISTFTDNYFNNVKYYSNSYYLIKVENGEIIREDVLPFIKGYSIASEERYKSGTEEPNIKTFLFDEFISRNGYLEDEFTKFMSLCSTLRRKRKDIKIFLLGNSINMYNPYFGEMGLKHVKQQKMDTIEIYTAIDPITKETFDITAVEYTGNSIKVTGFDRYSAFDNPKLKMIQTGAWEIDFYPKLPVKYDKKEVIYFFFIEFDDLKFRADIVYNPSEDKDFIFIYNKTSEIKEDDKLVYTQKQSYKQNYRIGLGTTRNEIDNKINYYFNNDLVFYQNNEVGDAIHNFIERSKKH